MEHGILSAGEGGESRGAAPAAGDRAQLVEQARSGDRAAFAALVDAHYDFIYRSAFKWLGQQSDAEDVAQDVVVRLATALKSFDGRSAFSTWLYTIVLNVVRDRQRKLARQNRGVKELAQAAMAAMPVQEHTAAGHELWQAVRALPDKQRDAVLLVYAEELSHAEAAEVMGCKEATVSWHIHAAKKSLKKLM